MSSSMHPDNDLTINPSGNTSIRDVMAQFKCRRNFLKGSLGMAAVATLGGFASPAQAYPVSPTPAGGGINFTGLPPNLAGGFVDAITVPEGYTAKSADRLGRRDRPAGRHGQHALERRRPDDRSVATDHLRPAQ